MSKKLYQSKTAWAAFVTSLTGVVAFFYPSALQVVAAHMDLILLGLGIVFGVLRTVTHGKIDLGISDN